MKILEKKYPKGSLKHQKTDGRYIDGYLFNNLKVLATNIVNDMTFLGVCFSSTLEVGTGKSVLMTQIGEAWALLMKQIHNIDVPFTTQNIVWRPKDLIDKAFEVPQYSMILVDEWEDAHYWSELGMTLRNFFRKCRQLNLFIILVIPNFFQLPINYAIGRSVFAIDVKFGTGFKRGNFDFYDFSKKRELYIKGKKTHNYHVCKPSFFGEFNDGYGVPEKEYRAAKLKDLENIENDETERLKPDSIMRLGKAVTVYQILQNKVFLSKEGINNKTLAHSLQCDERTIRRLNSEIRNSALGIGRGTADTFIKKHLPISDNTSQQESTDDE